MICRLHRFFQKQLQNQFKLPALIVCPFLVAGGRSETPAWGQRPRTPATRQTLLDKALARLLWSWVMVGCLVLGGAIAWFGNVPAALADNYNKEFLVQADFSGKDLTDSSFTKANLRGANLSRTNLEGVSFFGANLESANLESANLSEATLDSARLARANLTNAVLVGAFAFNAKFDGATVDGADFTDVLLRSDVQDQLCAIAKGTNPVTGRETRETLECF
jgi:uncharacterized protein YjbI with pentapeptide repeats